MSNVDLSSFGSITSRANRLIAEAAGLRDKKRRDEAGLFLCEGIKLVREAAESGAELGSVFIAQSAAGLTGELSFIDSLPAGRVFIVSDPVFDKISTEKAPQGVICTVKYLDKLHKSYTIYNNAEKSADTPPERMTANEPDPFYPTLPERAILLDGISDPGNLGTILRSAAAFGCGVVILGPGCADIYNNKTVRASMGAVFRQPTLCTDDLAGTVIRLRGSGAEVYSAVLDAKYTITGIFGRGKPAYAVIGNEGHGVSTAVASACSAGVTIPMAAGTESLNAAVAASIFLYEADRAGR